MFEFNDKHLANRLSKLLKALHPLYGPMMAIPMHPHYCLVDK
jgi:hypothetical protein